MEARRSKRTRNAPKPIYEVEDKRLDEDGSDGQSNEAMSSEEEDDEEHDDEEGDETFAPLAPKKSATPRARKPKLRTVPEERAPKPRQPKKKLLRDANGNREHPDANGEEQSDEEDAGSFFDALKLNKPVFHDLMTRWREKYEENNDKGTRELLNFIFEACGGDNPLIADTDVLDKIDMNDMVQYVVEDLAKSNNGYPFASRFKALKKFQGNFVGFWGAFVNECVESELLFSSDIVDNIVDWMTTLSSAEVRAIRHTATVGVFAISSALVGCAHTITQQLIVVNRQMNVDSAASTNSTSKKSELLKENKKMFERRLRQVMNIIKLIFNGVLVHRYRDVMPEIRVESAQTLKQWVTTLPDHFLKDSYLKYLGWMLNDKEAVVRLGAVNVLRNFYEIEDFAEKLELFNSRFFPRYLEMCGDVDDRVVEACIQLLIAADKRELVTMDDDMQAVEKLVFEPNSGSIRKAAAEFCCMQYDAFGVAESKEKLSKDQLEKQAIALVEFAEENIRNHDIPVESVEILVDAFWNLHDCQVLHDWKLITNMLLADKSTPDMSSDQQTILLWILVGSIRKIVCPKSDNSNTPAALKKQLTKDKEEIAVSFCKEIPDLLIQYQSDAQKLFLVVELIPMLSLSSDVIGQHHAQIKALLERLKHVFLNHSEDKLLASVSLAIKHLLQAEHETVKRDAEVVVHEIFQNVLDRIHPLLESDKRLILESRDQYVDRSVTRKTRGSAKEREINDVEYALRVALGRLACMIRQLNPREYFPASILPNIDSDTASTTSRMDTMATALVKLIQRRSKSILHLDAGFYHEDIIKNALMILYLDLLWVTNPIFKATDATTGSDGVSEIDSAKMKVAQDHITAITQSRSCLEESLISVLEMHLRKIRSSSNEETKESEVMGDFVPEEMEEIPLEDEEVANYIRDAQRCAFIIFCDTQCLFTEKLRSSSPPFDALEWAIPKALLLLTRMYFDYEMEMEEPEADQTDAEQIDIMHNTSSEMKAQQLLKAELLAAIGKVTLCNPSNKGQAAAILQYFIDSGTPSVEVVKLFSKQMKTEAPIRYLEIQMTALRRLFGSLLSMREELLGIPPDSEEYDSISEDFVHGIERAESELRDLARKFSQSLGVGKIALPLRAPFYRFLCEGVRFSLEKPEHFVFLESLRPYLSHVELSSTKQLRSYFEQQLQRFDEVPNQDDLLDPAWRYVFDFQSALTITKKGSKKADQAQSVQLINSPSLTDPAASSENYDNIIQDQTQVTDQETDEYAHHGDEVDAETEEDVVMAETMPNQTQLPNGILQEKMIEDEGTTTFVNFDEGYDHNSTKSARSPLRAEYSEELSNRENEESLRQKMRTRSTRTSVNKFEHLSNSRKRSAATKVVERSKRQKTEMSGNSTQDNNNAAAAEDEIDSRRARRLRRAQL